MLLAFVQYENEFIEDDHDYSNNSTTGKFSSYNYKKIREKK